MKITESKLRQVIREELAVIAVDATPLVDQPGETPEELLADLMGHLVARLRAVNLWFHAAHHLAKGPGFIGDHTDLYGEIYERLNEDYDVATEKAVSLTGDEGAACPQRVVSMAAEKLQDMPSPSGMGAEQIAVSGLQIMADLNSRVAEMFEMLEAAGALPLGLNDFLAASANQYETYIYLLQQRVKG